MASTPDAERTAKAARKRPVQPVIPVVPYVAPRKGSAKPQFQAKLGHESPALSDTPSSAEVYVDSKSTVVEDATELPVAHQVLTPPASDVHPCTESSTNETDVHEPVDSTTLGEQSLNDKSTLTVEQEQLSSSQNAEDGEKTIVLHENEQSRDEEHNFPAENGHQAPAEDEIEAVQEPEVRNASQNHYAEEAETTATLLHANEEKGYNETPGTSSKETTAVEVEDQKSLKFPHRKSELAPEALTNGQDRKTSDFVPSSHHSNSSVSSQPPLPTLYEHFLFLFNSKQMVDTIIQVHFPDQATPPTVYYAHAAILMRSERLAKLLSDVDTQPQSRVISIYPHRNLQPYAFDAAVRFLYSDQVLSPDALFPRDVPIDKQVRAHLFDYLISYWIAGIELGLEPVKNRAYEFLKEFLDWDVLELAVKEAYSLRASTTVAEGSPVPESAMVSKALFLVISRFITDRLNLVHFKLDAEAVSVDLPSRFSQLEPGRGMANPALASMVFGSMPSHTSPAPSTNSVASTILLNLDFIDLETLATDFVTWHGSEALRVMGEVIEEREKRRAHAIGNRMMPNKQRLSNSAIWENAGWREYLEDGTLKRERVGFLLPTKQR